MIDFNFIFKIFWFIGIVSFFLGVIFLIERIYNLNRGVDRKYAPNAVLGSIFLTIMGGILWIAAVNLYPLFP